MMPYFRNYIPTDISCYRSDDGVESGLHGEDLGGERVPAPIVELTCGAPGTDQNSAPFIGGCVGPT
jgi:hypothetical protein